MRPNQLYMMADDKSTIQVKPTSTTSNTTIVRPKRSLASFLSVDNNDINDNHDTRERSSNSNHKRRKTNDSKWDLPGIENVPELPFLYVMETTSIVVLNEIPQNVATRIVDCAKALGAYGQYDGQKAQATLSVHDDDDYAKFKIQLYKVSEKSSNSIIVEIQRTSGNSIHFHKIARSLLQAAANTVEVEERDTHDNSSLLSERTTLPQDLKQSSASNSQDEIFTCTLELIDALSKKDRVDANLLGMKSLQLLTSQKSTSDALAQSVSNEIITRGRFHDLKNMIRSLLSRYNSATDEETSCNDSSSNCVVEGYFQEMRLCALSILSNSLKNILMDDTDIVSKRDNVDTIISSNDWLGDEGLLALLIGELKNANTHPREAYLAGKCLEVVLLKSLLIRSHACKLDIYHVLNESSKVGEQSYPLLGSVSDKILQIMGEAK